MRIGLDIDNVITNFDEVVLAEFLIEDRNKRGAGIINPNADWIARGMFDWSRDEIHDFFKENMEEISKKLQPLDGARYFINKLLGDGCELYLISNRPDWHYKNPYEVTANWLKENDINYTKLIISESSNKTKKCLDYKIDVMVDDIVQNCNQLASSGVKCFLMETKYNTRNPSNLVVAKDWDDLYDKICKLS